MTDRLPAWHDMTPGAGFGLRRRVMAPEEPPGRALDHEPVKKRDRSTVDKAERQIETFISRAHDQRVAKGGPEWQAEAAWAEQDMRLRSLKRAENASLWQEHHTRLAAALRSEAARHDLLASRYRAMGEEPKTSGPLSRLKKKHRKDRG